MSAGHRGSLVRGLELRRQGSQLLLDGQQNRVTSAVRRDSECSSTTGTGILQRRKTQNQLNTDVVKEDAESGSSKKVDFQRGMDYTDAYTKLCRLLTEGSKIAVKEVFDRFFPPIILQDKLSNPNMHKRLEFLANKGLIDDKQWQKLYPKTRQRALSGNYDTLLLLVILKHVCKLPPPYPDGWYNEPRRLDDGVSANLARLGLLRKDVTCRPDMDPHQTHLLWSAAMHVLVTFTDEVTQLAEKIDAESLDEDVRYIYVKRLYTLQDRENDIMEREEMMKRKKNTNDIVMMSLNLDMSSEPIHGRMNSVHETAGWSLSIPSLSSRRPSTVSSVSQHQQQQQQRRGSSASVRYIFTNKAQGMPKEERHTLLTFYKSLVTHVKAPEIMDQLIKAEIFTSEDKIKVFFSEKNRDRMDALLRILLTKPAAAYTEFCKPIKFKHAHLYELMNRTYTTLKKQAASRKPDGLTHTMEHIHAHYTHVLTTWSPINWSGAPSTGVGEHYTPLHLVTQDGQHIEAKDIVDSHMDRCAVLVEGGSGSGKSALCLHLLYAWLNGLYDSLGEFALMFLIDCRRGQDLKQALHDQMSKEYQFDKEELWHILDDNQKRIIFVLDGLEQPEGEYLDLVSGELFPNSGVIVTTRSGAIMSQHFSRKVNLIGLHKHHVGEFIKKYLKLTGGGPEDFSGFYHKLNDCGEEYQVFVLNPFLCSCLCAIRANKTSCNVTTETELLEEFLQALMKIQAGKRMEFYDLIAESIFKLQKIAFSISMGEFTKISIEDVERKCGIDILKTGLLVSFEEDCVFLNKTIQDFLTARYIRTLRSVDSNHIVEQLGQDRTANDICRFLCGMQAKLENETILKGIVEDVGENNLKIHKAVRFVQGTNTLLRGLYSARVTELSLSLQCVHESQGCEWIAKMVAGSLPQRLVLKSGTISQNALLGLADILRLNVEGVKEIDVYISEEMTIRRYGLLKIAEAIRNNEHITFLRVEWTCNELFSTFLSEAFCEETKIHTVKMIDRSRKSNDMLENAMVQAKMIKAFRRMTHVKTIIFQDCPNPSIVASVIRSCTLELENLDLSGCQFSIISAKELAHYLEYTTNLVSLNLTEVRLSGSIFSHFTKGLKSNKTLQELILCNCKIDQMGELLLADSIQFNHQIKKLDISKNAMTWTGCHLISEALKIQNSLNELVILGEELLPEGLAMFKKIENADLVIVENSFRQGALDIYAD